MQAFQRTAVQMITDLCEIRGHEKYIGNLRAAVVQTGALLHAYDLACFDKKGVSGIGCEHIFVNQRARSFCLSSDYPIIKGLIRLYFPGIGGLWINVRL